MPAGQDVHAEDDVLPEVWPYVPAAQDAQNVTDTVVRPLGGWKHINGALALNSICPFANQRLNVDGETDKSCQLASHGRLSMLTSSSDSNVMYTEDLQS